MSVKLTVEGDGGVFWAESVRTNCQRSRECNLSAGTFTTRTAALRDMVQFCQSTIRLAEIQLKKEPGR